MLVHFLTAHSFKAHSLTYPLRIFSNQLEEMGIRIKFYYRVQSSLSDCDVLCLSTEAFRPRRINPRPPKFLDLIKRIRPQVRTIIWFDQRNSSGTTQFLVLPFVDLYAKNQLLKDPWFYLKPQYGNRIYSDYYHKTLDISDPNPGNSKFFIHPYDFDKLAVSWNFGLGDYRTNLDWRRRLNILLPYGIHYRFKSTPPQADRPIKIVYRASENYIPTVAYQRKKTCHCLESLAKQSTYRIIYQGKVHYNQYMREMRQAAIVPSPFGLGEICPRDFECFIAGAALLKPDMNYLITWPDYYIDNQTYVPHAWDFSDFEEKITLLINKPNVRRGIAAAGQDRYLQSISAVGGKAFALHLMELIQKAQKMKSTPTEELG